MLRREGFFLLSSLTSRCSSSARPESSMTSFKCSSLNSAPRDGEEAKGFFELALQVFDRSCVGGVRHIDGEARALVAGGDELMNLHATARAACSGRRRAATPPLRARARRRASLRSTALEDSRALGSLYTLEDGAHSCADAAVDLGVERHGI